MFEMSVKSVPGCLVLIAPSTIGVPVAATPGLGPHCEVLDEPLEALELPVLAVDELADAEPLLAPPGGVLVVLLLLPQPAITSAPAIAATKRPRYCGRRDPNAEPIQTSLISRLHPTTGLVAVVRLLPRWFRSQDR